ncbi:MAG TPA: rhodanese-like domain-containing protein, partial [Bryobacteraceae bacterium]|nr:rhodanese-like domain-containing protein [Bryobacteraceae bacterium]
DPNGLQVVDVRRASEWQGGHVEQARHKPLDHLAAHLDDLDKTKLTAVYCKGGYRSSIASSLLQRAGFAQVMNVTGGFDAWLACRLPYVTDEAAVAG